MLKLSVLTGLAVLVLWSCEGKKKNARTAPSLSAAANPEKSKEQIKNKAPEVKPDDFKTPDEIVTGGLDAPIEEIDGTFDTGAETAVGIAKRAGEMATVLFLDD